MKFMEKYPEISKLETMFSYFTNNWPYRHKVISFFYLENFKKKVRTKSNLPLYTVRKRAGEPIMVTSMLPKNQYYSYETL